MVQKPEEIMISKQHNVFLSTREASSVNRPPFGLLGVVLMRHPTASLIVYADDTSMIFSSDNSGDLVNKAN